jgi:hypothetical protein
MKKQPKTNGGAVRSSKNEPRTPIVLFSFLLVALVFPAFGQISVISGGAPLFPWKSDSVLYVAKFETAKKLVDSVVTALDTGLYEEFKRSVDTTIQYVDAVRVKREEIGGSRSGPKFFGLLHFLRDKKRIVQVSFCRKGMRSALLDVKSEKYPFVVTLKPDFAAKLDSIDAAARKKH